MNRLIILIGSRSLLLEHINMSRDSKEVVNEKKSLRESMKDTEDFKRKNFNDFCY